MPTVADLLPLLGLRVTAGPLELRGITDDDLVGLAELAGQGIHAPESPASEVSDGRHVTGSAVGHFTFNAYAPLTVSTVAITESRTIFSAEG